MAKGPRSSPQLASWREPSIPLRNYLEGFVTLSALVAVNAAGNRRHAAADAPTQVRNEPARSSLKCGRRSR